MGDLLLEGVRASVEPCSLALVLPGIGTALLGGRRGWAAAIGFWAAAAVLAWAQASLLLDVPTGVGLELGLAACAVLGAAVVWRLGGLRRVRSGPYEVALPPSGVRIDAMAAGGPHGGRPGGAAQRGGAVEGRGSAAGPAETRNTPGGPAVGLLGGGLLIGAAAGLLWRPCVGPELGLVLTSAPDVPGAALPDLAVYLLGVLVAVALVAAAAQLAPPASSRRARGATAVVAAIPLLGLVGVLVSGRYAEVIGTLVRLSSL